MSDISALRHSVEMSEFLGSCRAAGAVVYEPDFSSNEPIGPAVLLLSHEMNLTGAPIALLTLARTMQGIGYAPVVISPRDGPLSEEYVRHGISVVVCPAKALWGWPRRTRGSSRWWWSTRWFWLTSWGC